MRINNNIIANYVNRYLSKTQYVQYKSVEKISSGYRINQASDDIAGISISEKMRAQIRGLSQAARNTQDGISLIQTAEGALNETHSILHRIRELLIQANNGIYQLTEKKNIQEEITQLIKEINNITNNTKFNNINILKSSTSNKISISNVGNLFNTTDRKITIIGSTIGKYQLITGDGSPKKNVIILRDRENNKYQTIKVASVNFILSGTVFNFDNFGIKLKVESISNTPFSFVNIANISGKGGQFDIINKVVNNEDILLQVGTNNNDVIKVSIKNMSAEQLGSDKLKLNNINVIDFVTNSYKEQLSAVNYANLQVSEERCKLGSIQNRLEAITNNLYTLNINLQEAEARIRDVDIIQQVKEYSKNKTLLQVEQVMVMQANLSSQRVLQLLE